MIDRQPALLGAIAVLVATSLSPPRAEADDTHYQDYPIGGRAVGLGGAFTAISDDPSGIYFNPAGIVDTNKVSVQISTTLYGLEVANSLFAAVQSVTNLKKVFTEINIIPTSASFIATLGDPDERGRPQQAYGLGVFIPSFRGVNFKSTSMISESEARAGCDQLAYQRNQLDRTFHFGGSYALRIDPTLSFGLSGFLVHRALRDLEETACFSPRSVGASGPFGTAQTTLDMYVGSLVLALGLKAELGDGWTAGLSVTTPTIRIYDGADVRLTRGSASMERGSQYEVRDLQGLSANSKLGTSLRGGVAKVVPELLTFVFDGTLEAPTSYHLFQIPGDDRDIREALTLVNEIERKLVVNFNTGVEYFVSEPFSLSGGLFTNFSSAPSVPGRTGDTLRTSQLPHVNAYGGSFVLSFFSKHTLTRVGLTMSYGSGEDVVPRYAGLGALGRSTEWVRIELNQLFLFFSLSSMFRY